MNERKCCFDTVVFVTQKGYVGMSSLDRSSRNNEVSTDINRINLYQYENQSLDTSYLYFLESSYLDNIVENLGKMEALVDSAEEKGESSVNKDISSMGDTVKNCKENYEEIRTFMKELSDTNGKTSEAFAKVVEQIHVTNESVKRIREAAELITSIADQTNLLSLNASIEAARAGETTASMAELNEAIANLVETSEELNNLAGKLDSNLKFFQIV